MKAENSGFLPFLASIYQNKAIMESAATDLFIGKFVAILESEAASIAGVRDQVDEIKQELAHTQVEKAWVASVRDLANDVENTLMSSCIACTSSEMVVDFSRWIHKTIHFPGHLWYKRQIANKLQKILVAIRAIPERNQRYRGAAAVEGKSTSEDIRRWVQNQAESSLYQKEDELVGIEGDKNIEAPNCCVRGRDGGSGKTTLVARTFKDDIVKRHFECYAWITISQSYIDKRIPQRKKEKVPADMNAMSYNELLEMLVNYLETKRFSFPDKQLGSRVMLTTRREDIASSSFGVESHVHKIRPLERSDAWCEGLPLAIVALSVSMVAIQIEAMLSILFPFPRRSYDDRIIGSLDCGSLKDLLNMWKGSRQKKLQRAILWNSFFVTCYRKGLQYTSSIKKDKFCAVHDGSETVEETGALRLSIQTTNGEIGSCTGISRLRSFLVFATSVSSFSFSNKLPFDLKLLKVLDLEDIPIDNLPDGVTSLFNLKHLNLKGTLIKELPESIGQLRNLQNLNIMSTKIEALPRGISKLLNLRHFLVGSLMSGKLVGLRIPSSISKMKKLQSLAYIESEGNIIRLIGSMTQLTFLGITNVKERDEEDLCASIQEMKVLSILNLYVADGEEFLRADALSSPPPYLDRLDLIGKLEKVPHWFCSLHSLTYLLLNKSRLEEDLLPHIEALPSLRSLSLENASVREELCFNRGFAKLRHLWFWDHALLNKITIEKGAMPNLEVLSIHNCLTLETLPQGIEHLTKLQRYRFDNVPEKFRESIKEGETSPGIEDFTREFWGGNLNVNVAVSQTNYALLCGETKTHYNA
ncbi:NB-ARC domain-containing disease resistance protein [Prunus dulcis]|uniref:NB-ARC domain-containing disease resistance protein n=1 Tax=Prunus dulcis TaxID=3755 RepID=A0A4Y1RNA0_PRUDU|nr:NB-ARC domain-containing disease resistance protein [Prunus dulcis]